MRSALAGVLALATSLLAIALFGPGAFASSGAGRMAAWSAHDSAILRSDVRAHLQREDYRAAATIARKAVAAMPFDSFALVNATLALDEEASVRALNVAAAMGWRDPVTNAALLEAALATDEATIAAQRVDAIGRSRPEAASGFLLDRVLAMPGGIEAVSARLARHGSLAWWETALRERPTDGDAIEARTALVAAIDPEDGMARRDLLESAAVGFGDPATAWQAWRRAMNGEAEFAGFVHDPRFAAFDPSRPALGGEWRVPRESRALFEPASAGMVFGVAPGPRGVLLAQAMEVEPGPARFVVAGEGDGLGWSLVCEGTEIFLEGEPQTRMLSGTWTVRIPQSCLFAELRLSTLGRNASRIDGRIDSVALEPAR